MPEQTLNTERNVLLITSEDDTTQYLRDHFAGRVILVSGEPSSCDPFPFLQTNSAKSSKWWNFPVFHYVKNKLFGKDAAAADQIDGMPLSIYCMGDIHKIMSSLTTGNYLIHAEFYHVREFSCNDGKEPVSTVDHPSPIFPGKSISVAQVPLKMHGRGIFVPRMFPARDDIYYNILNEHTLVDFRESNKPTNEYRKGLYITPVTKVDEHTYGYHLLRCSTNLAGPTDDVCDTDTIILAAVNHLAEQYFDKPVDLNHVLAQLYCNDTKSSDRRTSEEGSAKQTITTNKNQKKATIKLHSGKTKDMPPEALIAFCSFYSGKGFEIAEQEETEQITDYPNTSIFDSYYKNTSVLTKLRFRLKKDVLNESKKYVEQFDVVLYPGSVFMMSLETNRLYTHEIVPSVLPVEKLPTRLSYVVRCSTTMAQYNQTDGQTFLTNDDDDTQKNWIKLRPPCDEEEMDKLKELYYEENATSRVMDYGNQDTFAFSLNEGDYWCPNVRRI